MKQPRVAVIVLNWNRREDTLECLRSLERLTYPNYGVIVVDNGSTDGSVEAVQEAFPSLQLLTNAENLGFAGGNNVGIRYALDGEADYVFLLNNDTVVDAALLDELVAAAEADPQIGLVGPKIYYYDQPDRLWYAGAREQWLRRIPATVGLDELDQGQYDQVRETAFVYGTAMLIRRQALEGIGLFDERFFAYHEDADFCMRARQAGYYCVYNPRGVIWHKVSAATHDAPHVQDYLRAKGRILFFVKHVNGIRLPLVLLYELYRLAKVWTWRLRDGRIENGRSYSRGLWDGVREFILRPEGAQQRSPT
ncbi:MAG: glycosyltransferase family 2 protein [Chloroflexi bacterium]|nr:MAG: glycosyltransferase family 2 protein [Chloroflexota bacterium]